jgi:threonylcarbamoyladenosine tRNA methylthiotransferase MtaB
MPDQVPVHIARERNRVLRELAAEKNLAFRKRFIGKILNIVTLSSGGDGRTDALSDNYLAVQLAGEHPRNQVMNVEVTYCDSEKLVALATETPAVSV